METSRLGAYTDGLDTLLDTMDWLLERSLVCDRETGIAILVLIEQLQGRIRNVLAADAPVRREAGDSPRGDVRSPSSLRRGLAA